MKEFLFALVSKSLFVCFYCFSTIYYSEFVFGNISALQQLSDGFDIRGLKGLMQDKPPLLEGLLVAGKKELLFAVFNDNLDPQFSERGSNKRAKEMELFQVFSDYLKFLSFDGKVFCFYYLLRMEEVECATFGI